MSAVQSLTVACVVTMEQYLLSELQLTTPTHPSHTRVQCAYMHPLQISLLSVRSGQTGSGKTFTMMG